MSALGIQFHRGGVFLPQLGLWLDPHEPKLAHDELTFVSHAHSDHTALHREIILSAPTSRLMHARIPGEWIERILEFNEKRTFKSPFGQEFDITLTPAGHIFGSAMSLIESNGESLLYTGDFKLRRGLSAEPCQPVRADTLIMETTYGQSKYRFPPTAEVIQGVIRFCREALDNEETPVLLGYSLGKSQEILCGLGEAGLPIMLHGTVHRLTKIYEGFGQCFPPYEKYEAGAARGKVLLCPPNTANSAMLRNLGKTRTAVLTGWAVDPSCRFRYQAHAAFPLSDHADFPDLIEFVKQVQPKKVYTLHGFASDFAQTLRDLGYDAQALSEEDQLALPLAFSAAAAKKRAAFAAPKSSTTEPAADNTHAFTRFAEACKRIGSTTKKLEKTRILADYFRELEGRALVCASVWFTGSPFAGSENKALQLGWAIIRDVLCNAADISEAEFGQIYLKHSDLGEATFEALQRRENDGGILTLESIDELFRRLHGAKGPTGKLPLLAAAIENCSPLEAKYLFKILTGDLRIGLKEGLVEDAIAQACNVPLDEIKQANLLLGHVGETASLARAGQLTSVTLIPFRPVKYMLASPEPTAADIWQRVLEWIDGGKARKESAMLALQVHATPPTVWIEDKYDGIRAQMHKVGDTVSIFSRDLKEITHTFQEIADAARKLPEDFIIDGELVAMRGRQALPYSELQRRLGRKEGDLFLNEQIPVQFVAFDLLWLTGESYMNAPLRTRRKLLENLSAFSSAGTESGTAKLPLGEFEPAMPSAQRSLLNVQSPEPVIVSSAEQFQISNFKSQIPDPEIHAYAFPAPLTESALRQIRASLSLALITQASSAEDIEHAFTAARARGNEGLMIKDPQSIYTPGRRGLAWLKLKKAFATLDCVVVAAEYGHGKRKDVLSDYTFAVRDDQSGELKIIGKAYSGLTDAEIARLTQHFLKRTVKQHGRFHYVQPDTVLEIAFDLLQPSQRHNSGLAMRFPRIVRIREDKTPADIDTLATAWRLARGAAEDQPA
ncbi:MAG TPA: MBL fold metallo-hydrolase RNA specificity domain-containing protein [Verrucomicrobiae bacterium]|nr:MBL fold metallo-hydrolase RNA specificity domain-containing protein [Verrucomicrobiae bacterium]